MENKKFEKLNDQELEMVSGGHAGASTEGIGAQPYLKGGDDLEPGGQSQTVDVPIDWCPVCNWCSLQGVENEWIAGKYRDVKICNSCNRIWYVNEAGEVVCGGIWNG